MDFAVNTRPLLGGSDSEDERETTTSENVVVSQGRPLFKPPEPRDKYCMAYVIFYLLGITTLLPWNFFMTADDVSIYLCWNLYLWWICTFRICTYVCSFVWKRSMDVCDIFILTYYQWVWSLCYYIFVKIRGLFLCSKSPPNHYLDWYSILHFATI